MLDLLKKLPSPELSGALLRQYTSDDMIADLFDPLDRPPVEELPCPNSGGEGCPRQVREMPDGTVIAVCGRYPQKCEEIYPDSIDTAIYGLNIKRVAAKIATEWQPHNVIMQVSIVNHDPDIVQIGYYNPKGDIKFPVFLHIPYFEGDQSKATEILSHNNQHYILALPSAQAVSSSSKTSLQNSGSMVVELGTSDITSALSEFCKLHPSLSEEEKLQSIAPPNTSWGRVSITFISRDTVSIKCGEQPAANYERVQIPGMFLRNQDYKKPTDRWFLLMALAQMGPYLSRDDLDKLFLNRDRKAQDQQKRQLSKSLKELFGINSEPITFCRKDKVYKPQLTIGRLNIDLTPWMAEINE